MPETPTLTEQTLSAAASARDDFLSKANDLFEGKGMTSVGEALDKAKPAEAPAAAPAAKTDATAKTIPGPPTAARSSAPQAQGTPPASPPASSQGATPSDDISDLPAADAFEGASNRPKGSDWKRLRSATDKYHSQLVEARREVETLKAQVAGAGRSDGVLPQEAQTQLKALQEERDTLLSRLEAVAVEKSPRFEQMFKPRTEAALRQAQAAVGPDRASKVAALLQQPESSYRDEQIEAIINDLGPGTLRAQKLLGSVAELDRIAGERAEMSNQGSTLYKQWQSEQQAVERRQQEERQRTVQATFDSVVNEWKQAGAQMDDDGLALARDVFMGNRDLKDIATASMWVAYGPKAAASALKLQQELAAAQQRIKELESVQPGNANGAQVEASDDIPPSTGYADAIVQAGLRAGLPLR